MRLVESLVYSRPVYSHPCDTGHPRQRYYSRVDLVHPSAIVSPRLVVSNVVVVVPHKLVIDYICKCIKWSNVPRTIIDNFAPLIHV